jgi:hypothetical protein
MTLYYWIAINRDSCTSASLPLPDTVRVSPIPQSLVGFPNQEEQIEAQKFLLTAPIDQIPYRLKEWQQRPDIKIIIPNNPQPPTRGKTLWTIDGAEQEA